MQPKRIQQACLAHDVIEPKFEEFQHGFRVTLYKQRIEENLGHEVNGGVSEGVNEDIKSLLNLITQHPGFRTTQMQNELSVPVKTLERWLKQLKEQDKIEFKGAPKTGGYYAKSN